MSYYISRALVALGIIMFLACIVFGVIAVWTTGDDAGKWGGTAGILGGAGFVVTMAAMLWADDTSKPYRVSKVRRNNY